MNLVRQIVYVLQPNGGYEEVANVREFEVKDGCLIVYHGSGVVGFNTHQWVTFTLDQEEI